MNIAPTLIALQTLYLINKHIEEDKEDDDNYDEE